MERPIVTQPRQRSYGLDTVTITGSSLPEVPEDLVYLDSLNEVRVYQKMPDEYEAHCLNTVFERKNQYYICNQKDEIFFYANEISDQCGRICTNTRPLTFDIVDDYGYHVMQVTRPFRCKSSICCCCHLQEMTINYPPSVEFANVKEMWSAWRPSGHISGPDGRLLFISRMSFCDTRCSRKQAFHVKSTTGDNVARVTKQVKDCSECVAMLNDFVITYYSGLSAYEKMIILGTSFFLDMTYMELRP